MWLNKLIPRVDPRGIKNPLEIQLDGTFRAGEFTLWKSYPGENGFGYLLKSISLVYPAWCDWNAAGGFFENPAGIINIEIFSHLLHRESAPVPSRLISLPANDGLGYCVTVPAAPNVWRSFLPANSLGSKKVLNHFFPFGDSVEIRLSRLQNNNDTIAATPAHKFNLVLNGSNCPEKASGVW